MKPTNRHFLSNPVASAASNGTCPVAAGKPARQLLCRLIVVLAIASLGVSAVFAANEEVAKGVTYSVDPPVSSPLEALSRSAAPAQAMPAPEDHMLTIQSNFQEFFHWQFLLRLFLGFALAVLYSWLLSWSPRRSVRSDPAADIEEGKTLVVLGMLGAVVAEVTKLSPTMAFVIFGIGSLVRFRTALDDPKLTGKAIMVVVIGLACGMNQWALGGFVTLAAWLLIFWLESHAAVRLKVTVKKKEELRAVYGNVQEFLHNNRCRVKTANLDENKHCMMFVTLVPAELNASDMETLLHTKLGKMGEDCEITVRVY